MPSAKWSGTSAEAGSEIFTPHSILGLNSLPPEKCREIYTGLIPPQILERYQIDLGPENHFRDRMLKILCEPGCPSVELSLYHQPDFPDPLLYGHICDTPNGPLNVLYYAVNDPESPRYDIDRLPGGESTEAGTRARNIPAELEAFRAGLAPGQVRRGLRSLGPIIEAFEDFLSRLGHEMFFVQPLFYHNAVIFERRGFAYAKGRRLMERIHIGFLPDGEFSSRLDGSTPFRSPDAAGSVRLRSWALHDGLLEAPLFNVTMYKQVGRSAQIDTCSDCPW